MDRNTEYIKHEGRKCNVALRKESVDRNTSIDNLTQGVFKSLSARRAWIEILKFFKRCFVGQVALRKESVDRNQC